MQITLNKLVLNDGENGDSALLLHISCEQGVHAENQEAKMLNVKFY